MRVLSVFVAAMVLTACTSARSLSVAEQFASLERQEPGSIAVPLELPQGFTFFFPDSYRSSGQGETVLSVCLPRGSEIVGTCVGTEDSSPWFETTTADGRQVVVVHMGGAEEGIEAFRNVEFTTNWRQAGWIDR